MQKANSRRHKKSGLAQSKTNRPPDNTQRIGLPTNIAVDFFERINAKYSQDVRRQLQTACYGSVNPTARRIFVHLRIISPAFGGLDCD